MTETYLHPERYAKSAALYQKALEFIPGGVNSTARAAFSASSKCAASVSVSWRIEANCPVSPSPAGNP